VTATLGPPSTATRAGHEANFLASMAPRSVGLKILSWWVWKESSSGQKTMWLPVKVNSACSAATVIGLAMEVAKR